MNKTAIYLYDNDLSHLINAPYFEVLLAKIQLAKQLLYKLVHVDNMEDHKRISDVCNAIKFNRERLMEIGLSSKEISQLLKEM